MQHIIHHLTPNGSAGVVLANGSMSSSQGGEDLIRKEMVDKDVIDCMVALPGQLFYSTQIPACLWFLTRNKNPGNKWRDRRNEILFIDARKQGVLIDRVRRELTDNDTKRISDIYHAWRGEKNSGTYEDIAGFCKSIKLEEIRKNDYVLTPARYVGSEELEDTDEKFVIKMKLLTQRLSQQNSDGEKLDIEISKKLAGLGYDI